MPWTSGPRSARSPTTVHPELIGTWMKSGESPHDIAFIKGPNGKLHHFAFHLGDWNDILKAGDIFSMDDVPIDIGPTRHGITRGMTILLFFDPSGNRNEVFASSYRPARTSPRSPGQKTSLARASSTSPVSSTTASPPCSPRPRRPLGTAAEGQ